MLRLLIRTIICLVRALLRSRSDLVLENLALRQQLAISYIRLLVCGRYSALTELLYHEQEGNPPFHVKSPVLPPGWESVEQHGRLDLEARRAPR